MLLGSDVPISALLVFVESKYAIFIFITINVT